VSQTYPSCEETVRKSDYDRYAATAFAPGSVRRHLFALYAFNYEIAKTAETVSEALAGQIRLQWWRDAIGELRARKTREHPVVIALGEVLRAHDLPQILFDQMIDAREWDLDEMPFQDMTSLETYADGTSGNVMRLAARILGAGERLDAAAREAGIAYAIAGLLRAMPYRAAERRLVLPVATLRTAGVSPDDVFAGKASGALTAVFAEMAEAARTHLGAAREFPTPRKFLPALLPAALAPLYLKVLTEADFNPFRDVVDVPIYRRQLAMLRASFRAKL
jgi:phytoene/squalene synthetase